MINNTHRLMVVVGFALLLAGATCNASKDTRRRYMEEVARCTANERMIVRREDSTFQEDEADLAAERARCDAALIAIEEGE